tara:strand:+ start:121 stop:366 length:246 start_codon:yes stop_codon:yes gene_type:complete
MYEYDVIKIISIKKRDNVLCTNCKEDKYLMEIFKIEDNIFCSTECFNSYYINKNIYDFTNIHLENVYSDGKYIYEFYLKNT